MTKIEWTDEVWNPVTGCDRTSPGCDHCYAATMAKRLKAMGPRPTRPLPRMAQLPRPTRWHLRPRGSAAMMEEATWLCQRPDCGEWCTNGELATDCYGIGSGWPDTPRVPS